MSSPSGWAPTPPAGLERGGGGAGGRQADYVLQLSDVTALSFDSGDGPLSFTLEETGWTWDGDSEFPVNGTELDALREDLARPEGGADHSGTRRTG